MGEGIEVENAYEALEALRIFMGRPRYAELMVQIVDEKVALVRHTTLLKADQLRLYVGCLKCCVAL